MATPRSVARAGGGAWLLDVDYGGYVLRVSSSSVVVDAEDGRTRSYQAGLTMADPARSAESIAVTIDGTAVDWPSLFARGQDPSTGVATLRRWYPGQTLEDADVRLVGAVDDVEWGARVDPLTASLVTEPWRDRTMLPGPTLQFGEDTWPVHVLGVADELVAGKAYPIIIGCPGGAGLAQVGEWYLLRTGGAVAAAPAYLAEKVGDTYTVSSKILVAGHAVGATECIVHDASDGTSWIFPLATDVDGLGQVVTVTDFATAGSSVVRPELGHAYFSAWRTGIDSTGARVAHGGLLRTDGSGELLRGLGEVLVWLYTQGARQLGAARSSVRFDAGRQEAQRAYLDRYLIDACISSPTSIDEWVRTHCESVFPIRWVTGSRGGYWLALRWDATELDAVATLSADTGRVRRVSRVRSTTQSAYSRFTLEYGRVADGEYIRRATLCGKPDPDNGDERASGRCLVAQMREATRTGGDGIREWSATSDVIGEDGTAAAALEALAARNAVPPIPATYEGDPELEALEIGDVVVVEDSEIGWTRRVALVWDLTPGDVVRVDLMVLADLARTRRSTT